MNKKLFLLVLLPFLFINWSNDPDINTPICTAPGNQSSPQIIPDDMGGYFITWQDTRNDESIPYESYMQRLDSTGNPLWQTNGKKMFSHSKMVIVDKLVPDKQGGFFIPVGHYIYQSSYYYDYYIKRMDFSGKITWTTPLIFPHCNYCKPRLLADGKGGVFLFSKKEVSGNSYLTLQHIDENGNFKYPVGGKEICSTLPNSFIIGAVSDYTGGFYLALHHELDNPWDYKYFICRLNSLGDTIWAKMYFDGSVDGVKRKYALRMPKSSSDSTGWTSILLGRKNEIYVCWYEYLDWYIIIKMQRFSSSGSKLITGDGVEIYRYYEDYYPTVSKIIPDNFGGVYLMIDHYYWDPWGYNHGLEVLQHVKSNGIADWGDEGIIITSTSDWNDAVMIEDELGNAIVAWEQGDYRDTILKAQKFNSNGQTLWAAGGITVSDRNYSLRKRPEMISNGNNGAILVWDTGTPYDNTDIYAQNVCAGGGLGTCALPVASIKGDRFAGIHPATFTFDGSGSYDPDGIIRAYRWDLGDGTTADTPTVTHTYQEIGTYKVILKVKDNSGQWSHPGVAYVKTIALDGLVAEFDPIPGAIKAKNRGTAPIRASLYDFPKREGERPHFIDLGLTFETNFGSWWNGLMFGSTKYFRALGSQETGTATITAKIQDKVLGTANVTFTWPKPPKNIQVSQAVNRSLLRGEYYHTLTWQYDSDQEYQAGGYSIYRSTNGGGYEKIGEVASGVTTYKDEKLSVKNTYTYQLTMVDTQGDESEKSAAVSPATTRLTSSGGKNDEKIK